MPLDERGQWWPNISPKQKKLIEGLQAPAAKRKFKMLLSGPRKASKTIGGLHALAFHGWTVPLAKARYSMCGRTQTDNVDGGAWIDFTETILPEWIAADFGMEWVTKPRMAGDTHKIYCEVTNAADGITRYQLDSVKIEDEVERIFKGKRFAGIYVPELSNFKNRRTFDVMEEALRVVGLRPEQHLFIGDTNPAPEGEDSWIYQLFFEFPQMDDDELAELIRAQDEHIGDEALADALVGLREMQAQICVHEFTIDDNPFLSEAEKRAQRAKYAHDKDLLDRYYYGKWVKAVGDSVFKDVFRPAIHIIGDPPSAKLTHEPEVLLPEDNCSELGGGWDIGSSNSSAHVIEDVQTVLIDPLSGEPVKDKVTGEFKIVPAFKVLDELISIGEPLPLSEFVIAYLEKMEHWEKIIGHSVMWTHVSDRSAFDKYDSISDSYEYKEVYAVSDGRIELERGPAKTRNSVNRRMQLLKKLFYFNRIWISSQCVQTIEMVQNLKAGRLLAIDAGSKYKHAFDSLTYYLGKKLYLELEAELQNKIGKPKARVHTLRLR